MSTNGFLSALPRLTMRHAVLIAALYIVGGIGSTAVLGIQHAQHPEVALITLAGAS